MFPENFTEKEFGSKIVESGVPSNSQLIFGDFSILTKSGSLLIIDPLKYSALTPGLPSGGVK